MIKIFTAIVYFLQRIYLCLWTGEIMRVWTIINTIKIFLLFPNVTFGYMVILITFTGLIKLQEDQRKLCKQL